MSRTIRTPEVSAIMEKHRKLKFKTIGKFLAEGRKAAKVKSGDIAKRAKNFPQVIASIEAGKCGPTPEVLKAWLELTGHHRYRLVDAIANAEALYVTGVLFDMGAPSNMSQFARELLGGDYAKT